MWTERDPEESWRQAEAAAADAAAELRSRVGIDRAEALFVMGSGWKEAADSLGDLVDEVPMADLPGFLPPTALGHGGTIRAVTVSGRTSLIYFGRTHLYEGHGALAVGHGIRTALAAGVRRVVLTNACGGINPDFRVGYPVIIRDHINFTGRMPLIGARFVDLTDVYTPSLREAARRIDPQLPEGVYAGWYGPAFETPAEIEMMRRLGADMVGMSTVLEAIAARAGGAEVLGLSLVTNRAAGMSGEKLSGEEVVDVARQAIPRLKPLLAGLAEAIVA